MLTHFIIFTLRFYWLQKVTQIKRQCTEKLGTIFKFPLICIENRSYQQVKHVDLSQYFFRVIKKCRKHMPINWPALGRNQVNDSDSVLPCLEEVFHIFNRSNGRFLSWYICRMKDTPALCSVGRALDGPMHLGVWWPLFMSIFHRQSLQIMGIVMF